MSQSDLFRFANNEPNDPETVLYKFDVPESSQQTLFDFCE